MTRNSLIPTLRSGSRHWVVGTHPSSTAVTLATAAVVLFLGAGCGKQPTPAPATAPAPTPAPSAATPVTSEPGAGLIAPAPLGPPPPDIPSVPWQPPTAADVVAPAPLPTPAPSAIGPRVIRIIAKQWEWQPREIRIRKDERVALEITSADVPHGINIPEFNINRALAPGRTERVEFTATKVGRFDFVCSVFCGQGHRDMRGLLIVE